MRSYFLPLIATVAVACTARSPQETHPISTPSSLETAADVQGEGRAESSPSNRQVAHGPSENRSAPLTPYRLIFQPFDLTSQLNETRLRIFVESDSAVPDQVLSDVAAAAALHDPDGAAISFEAKIHPQVLAVPPANTEKGAIPKDVIGADGNPGERAYIELQTQKPFVPGWHEFGLKKLPEGAMVPYPMSYMTKPKFGVVAVRFNSVSAPVVKEVHVCLKANGNWTGGLTVSEPVVASEIAAALAIGPPGGPCQVSPSQVPSPTVQFSCPGSAIGAPWHILLQPGAKSVSGIHLELIGTPSASDATLDFSTVQEIEGCRYYRF